MRVPSAYAFYFNQARPHRGLEQRIPDPLVHAAPPLNQLNNELKRTHRKIDRKRYVFHNGAKQPKWKSKNENQDKECEW